mmetsp:Transcript_19981/g.56607  ORF Transcript_19981/g.56607 Transcript_19981/m.56607 type:complete len:296 (-) Transcript_19981:3120-4007(-)
MDFILQCLIHLLHRFQLHFLGIHVFCHFRQQSFQLCTSFDGLVRQIRIGAVLLQLLRHDLGLLVRRSVLVRILQCLPLLLAQNFHLLDARFFVGDDALDVLQRATVTAELRNFFRQRVALRLEVVAFHFEGVMLVLHRFHLLRQSGILLVGRLQSLVQLVDGLLGHVQLLSHVRLQMQHAVQVRLDLAGTVVRHLQFLLQMLVLSHLLLQRLEGVLQRLHLGQLRLPRFDCGLQHGLVILQRLLRLARGHQFGRLLLDDILQFGDLHVVLRLPAHQVGLVRLLLRAQLVVLVIQS